MVVATGEDYRYEVEEKGEEWHLDSVDGGLVLQSQQALQLLGGAEEEGGGLPVAGNELPHGGHLHSTQPVRH